MKKGEVMSEEQKQKISRSKKGITPWNKGLTKTDPRVRKNVQSRTKTVRRNGTFALENNPRWKGGKRIYNKIAIEHYGPVCVKCGSTNNKSHHMHVHHKDGNRDNNKIENLEVRCAKCHKEQHRQKASEYQKKRASETHKGRPKSEEHKRKIAIAMQGNNNRTKSRGR